MNRLPRYDNVMSTKRRRYRQVEFTRLEAKELKAQPLLVELPTRCQSLL